MEHARWSNEIYGNKQSFWSIKFMEAILLSAMSSIIPCILILILITTTEKLSGFYILFVIFTALQTGSIARLQSLSSEWEDEPKRRFLERQLALNEKTVETERAFLTDLG